MALLRAMEPALGWKVTGGSGLGLIAAAALFITLAAVDDEWNTMTYAESRLRTAGAPLNITIAALDSAYYVLLRAPPSTAEGGASASYNVALPRSIRAGLWYSCDTVSEQLRSLSAAAVTAAGNGSLLWSRERCIAHAFADDADFDYASTEYRWFDYTRKAQSCVILVMLCLSSCLATGLAGYVRKHAITAMLTATLSMYTVIYSAFAIGIVAAREEAAPGFTFHLLPEAMTSQVDTEKGPSFYYAIASLALTVSNAVTWMAAWKFLTKVKMSK